MMIDKLRSLLNAEPVLERLRRVLPPTAFQVVQEIQESLLALSQKGGHAAVVRQDVDGQTFNGVGAVLGDLRSGTLQAGLVLQGDVLGGTLRAFNLVVGDIRDGAVSAINVLVGDVYGGSLRAVNAVVGDIHGGEVTGVGVIVGDVHGGRVKAATLIGDIHGGEVQVARHLGDRDTEPATVREASAPPPPA